GVDLDHVREGLDAQQRQGVVERGIGVGAGGFQSLLAEGRQALGGAGIGAFEQIGGFVGRNFELDVGILGLRNALFGEIAHGGSQTAQVLGRPTVTTSLDVAEPISLAWSPKALNWLRMNSLCSSRISCASCALTRREAKSRAAVTFCSA